MYLSPVIGLIVNAAVIDVGKCYINAVC